ncbi:hypothetical protein [Paenibacillus sp. MER 99-2]|uniref:hypothetical protein n=1 Tax=Paenibacillus sp. MER 99-2 TaxID=2939572 RepID=UPI00203EE444|nr:hypothetical protein [Paenibacillus sp. MER 99-2]MCM3170856.1 hypothetical protein [Paenibacillus sp. MER 99-2]
MSFYSVPLPELHPSPGTLIAIQELTEESPDPERIMALALNDHAELWKLNLHTGVTERILQTNIPDLNLLHPVQIVISPDGAVAAVSNVYGQHAAVYDLLDGKEILQLSRDDYHYDVSTYPLSFAYIDQRLILVHGTEWNRLDLTDVLLGESLTVRHTPIHHNDSSQNTDEPDTSEHYLDYFHGKLSVSPDQKWIVDSGWVWAPLGITRSWSLENWLSHVWESEDGSSIHDLWQTMDWDLPSAWIAPHTIAIWGQVDEEMVDEEDWEEEGVSPAIIFFNAQTGERIGVITSVPAFNTTSPIEGVFPHAQAGMAADEDTLFTWRHGLDLHVWNCPTLTCIATTTEVHPQLYHHQAKLFIGLSTEDAPHRLLAWRYDLDKA